MLLRLFSGNQPISLLLLPLFAPILWASGLFADAYPVAGNTPMPLYALLLGTLQSMHWLQLLLACVLVLLQAFFVNSIANDLHFLEKRSNLPGFCFVLLNAVFPEQLELSPVLLANTFLLLAMFRLYAIAGSERAGSMVFDAAFLIGLAGLLYAPALLLLPIVYFVLNDFRPFNGREWSLPLIGAGLPWLFAWTWFFWFDETHLLANSLAAGFAWAGSGWIPHSVAFYALSSFSLLVLIVSIPQAIKAVGQNVVNVRKSLQSLLWLMLLLLFSTAFAPVKSLHLLTLATFPLSIWLTQLLQQSKRKTMMELVLLLWLGLIFYHRFA